MSYVQRRFSLITLITGDGLVHETGKPGWKALPLLDVLNEFHERIAALEERAADDDRTRLERSEQ